MRMDQIIREHQKPIRVVFDCEPNRAAELVGLIGFVNADPISVNDKVCEPGTLLITGITNFGKMVTMEGGNPLWTVETVISKIVEVTVDAMHFDLEYLCEDNKLKPVTWNRVYRPEQERFCKITDASGRPIYEPRSFDSLAAHLPSVSVSVGG